MRAHLCHGRSAGTAFPVYRHTGRVKAAAWQTANRSSKKFLFLQNGFVNIIRGCAKFIPQVENFAHCVLAGTSSKRTCITYFSSRFYSNASTKSLHDCSSIHVCHRQIAAQRHALRTGSYRLTCRLEGDYSEVHYLVMLHYIFALIGRPVIRIFIFTFVVVPIF
jgi:hypothetical protein